jgi:hypothetical protein
MRGKHLTRKLEPCIIRKASPSDVEQRTGDENPVTFQATIDQIMSAISRSKLSSVYMNQIVFPRLASCSSGQLLSHANSGFWLLHFEELALLVTDNS